ncbi:multi-sensor signal transduction histidine kinase [Calothrix brevissima NIES-22]|nr:multi-sensor signal transduction histidine kinase [Calothrix brevissima NIES-22]
MFAIRRKNRFQPVDSSDEPKQGSTGLALTISEQPIEQHSDRTWTESHLGCGSKFALTLLNLESANLQSGEFMATKLQFSDLRVSNGISKDFNSLDLAEQIMRILHW